MQSHCVSRRALLAGAACVAMPGILVAQGSLSQSADRADRSGRRRRRNGRPGVKYNPIPFSGAAPAVLALMGGHVDAVAVSPGEVATYVAAGKLKTLAVMADRRLKGFDNVPTLKERGIDLSIGTWRGLGAPKGTPPDVLAVLVEATRKSAEEPVIKDALDRLSMGYAYAGAETFRANMKRDNENFKQLVTKLGIKS
jgi:tripartite-type tricarboxylate transporter receptor subunit TctC